MTDLFSRIVSITELRRNFGEITARLAEIDSLILTKGGEPFAVLSAAPNIKRKKLKNLAGVWKKTALDDDRLWKAALTKTSRTISVAL